MVSAQLLAPITCGRASWILRQVLWSCSWSPQSGQAGHDGTWRSIQRHNVCCWGTWNVIGLLPPHPEMHRFKEYKYVFHPASLIYDSLCSMSSVPALHLCTVLKKWIANCAQTKSKRMQTRGCQQSSHALRPVRLQNERSSISLQTQNEPLVKVY